jgi:hypothetical protein
MAFSFQAFYFSYPHACYMPRPSHLPNLIILIIFGEEYNYGAPHYAFFTPSSFHLTLFGPNILQCSVLIHLNLCYCRNETDQVSYPHKTTGEITSFLYFNRYVFRQQAGRQTTLNCIVLKKSYTVKRKLILKGRINIAWSKVNMYYMEFQLLEVLSVNNIPQKFTFPNEHWF